MENYNVLSLQAWHLVEIFTELNVEFSFLAYENIFCLFSDQPEKAIASLQALIEFNCFTHDEVLSMPASGQKQFFEAFWDSEAPR